ncbi:MAG: dynamin family protein [Chloroflexi bacterium]|nr:dynamin family protein [Chloroflexota bacterium]
MTEVEKSAPLNERTLQQLFKELERLTSEAGATDLSARIGESERAFKAGKLRILLLGQFNHGKTLALNTLLGQPDFLPVGATPNTPLVTEISYGPEPEATLLDNLGRHKTVGLAEYRRLVGNLEEGRYRRAEISTPLALLKDFTFIDTPGLSDPDRYDPETLGPEISNADVIVFLLSAIQPLTASEQIFIKEKLTRKSQKRLFFIVNQTDRLGEDEDLTTVMERVNSLLATLQPGAIVLPFSAFEAAKLLQQAAKSAGTDNTLLERSNYGKIKAALTTELLAEKERLQEATLLGGMEEVADELEKIFEERQTAGKADLDQLEETRLQLKGERDRLEKVLLRLQERSLSELQRLADTFISDLSSYTRRLSNALPEQIEAAQKAAPNEVSRNLPFYLEYALKHYLEARTEQFKDELSSYMQVISQEIEQEFHQTVQKLDPNNAYFLATLPRLRQKDTMLTWVARGVTGLGAITIFMFGNILVGILWLVAGEVVRQAGAMREQERGRLVEAGRKALGQALEVAQTSLQAQFGDVKRSLGTELAMIFSNNVAALETRLNELERQRQQSAEERAKEAIATGQALSDLSDFKTRLAILSEQLIQQA